MKLVLDTVAYCQRIAEEKGHNIGKFHLKVFGNGNFGLVAICDNPGCLWGISIDPLRPGEIEQSGSLVIRPFFANFCLMGDCSLKRVIPEAEIFSEQLLKKKVELAFTDSPLQINLDVMAQSVGHHQFKCLRQMVFPAYFERFSAEELAQRTVRKHQLEQWLLSDFDLVTPIQKRK